MTPVERAADVMSNAEDITGGLKSYSELAQALADAGLLRSDADRAVLDAGDRWERMRYTDFADASSGLSAAVRARRETQP